MNHKLKSLVAVDGTSYTHPIDWPLHWKDILGPDVLSLKTSLSSRLHELGFSECASVMNNCLKKIPEFNAWYSRKDQHKIGNSSSTHLSRFRYTLNDWQQNWRDILGPDVLLYKITVRSRLIQLGYKHPQSPLNLLESIQEFMEWYSPTKQREIGSASVDWAASVAKASATRKVLKQDPAYTKQIITKRRATNISRYGVEVPLKNDRVHSDFVAKLRSLYSDEGFMASFRKAMQEPVLVRFGIPNIAMNKGIWDSLKHQFPGLSDVELIREYRLIRLREFGFEADKASIPAKSSGALFKAKCLLCNNVVEIKYASKPSSCPICGGSRSVMERRLYMYLYSLFGSGFIKSKDMSILKSINREIDILIPSKKVGFEINGGYTHCSPIAPCLSFGSKILEPLSHKYHVNKTEEALSQGVLLYHLWDHWPIELLKSIMLAKLGKFESTYSAKELGYSEVSNASLRQFLDSCHHLGFCKAQHAYALMLGSEIKQVLTFNIDSRSNSIVLVRGSSSLNTLVKYGFQRLFKHVLEFAKANSIERIITYLDRDLTPDPKDNHTVRAGFAFCGWHESFNYYCCHSLRLPIVFRKAGIYNRRRFRFTERRIAQLEGLPIYNKMYALSHPEELVFKYDPVLTEQQNLFKLDVHPLYTSGTFKYEYTV